MAHRSLEGSQEPRGGGEGELMPSPTGRPDPLPCHLSCESWRLLCEAGPSGQRGTGEGSALPSFLQAWSLSGC